ncbi:hypothetical protein [Rhizobium tumorigenes]|uniref:Uncharacterized protein n=1 Tax=Rhizobium tumorigenes TaxID=2041385 RepID=A0AAF1KTE5_9HYPH|nr:hypothetical protein [Rhizobium tumorigenes]WFR97105.1 hypothetical protein PR017_08380 [Rhizobium tumorigenes]WFS02666.1 hypothetical protein PR016_08730 [Rhizobium tumorigenes]
MKLMPVLVATVLLFPGISLAAQCTPNDGSARILASPNPDDIHPDWSDGSTIGLSWTFEGKEVGDSGDYMKGKLISPRGDVANKGVYIIAREWDCTE